MLTDPGAPRSVRATHRYARISVPGIFEPQTFSLLYIKALYLIIIIIIMFLKG